MKRLIVASCFYLMTCSSYLLAELVPVDDEDLSNVDGNIGIILDEIKIEQAFNTDMILYFGINGSNRIHLSDFSLSGPNDSGYTMGTHSDPITIDFNNDVEEYPRISIGLPSTFLTADPLYLKMTMRLGVDSTDYRIGLDDVYFYTDQRDKFGELTGQTAKTQFNVWSEPGRGVYTNMRVGMTADRIFIASSQNEGTVSLFGVDTALVIGEPLFTGMGKPQGLEIYGAHYNTINELVIRLEDATKNPSLYGHAYIKNISVGNKNMVPVDLPNTVHIDGLKLLSLRMRSYD